MTEEKQNISHLEQVRDPNVTHERIMEIYNKEWAEKFDEEVDKPNNEGPRKLALLISKFLPDNKDAKIVDLAGGTGLCAEELVISGYHNLDSIDASEAMSNIARKKGLYKNYIFETLGPNRLSIPDGTYDAATICGGFCPGHVSSRALKEIARIIKIGGYFVGVIRESYLAECDFLRDVEQVQEQMEDAGIWKRLVRSVELYHQGHDGVFFAFQVISR